MSMDLVTGFALVVQQTLALLKKNVILSMRNRRATILQLFSSFFFMAFLFGMKKGTDFQQHKTSVVRENPDPKPVMGISIPPCEKKLLMRQLCYDFVWSGSGSQRIQSIVKQIMANNPGRPISPDKVKSFKTKDEVYKWLMANVMTVPGVLHFTENSQNDIRYAVQTNSSSYQSYVKIGRQTEDPTLTYQIPLQFAASREIARSLLQDTKFGWDVGLTEFAHPSLKTEKKDGIDITTAVFTRLFLVTTAIFGFVFQISSIVEEKELKLRQAMTMMGLYDTTYWCSWLIWEASMAFLSSFFVVAFCQIFRIDVFTRHNFVQVFLLFFLFQISMVGFAFLLSVFIGKLTSTTSVCFSIFIIAFLTVGYDGFLCCFHQIL